LRIWAVGGTRIRVKAERAEAAAKLFAENGFTPIYIDRRANGDVSFWFRRTADDALGRLVNSIPREFYVLRATVGTLR
jgi:hypothetical protein